MYLAQFMGGWFRNSDSQRTKSHIPSKAERADIIVDADGCCKRVVT
jgi:hypothetical protein